MGITLEHVSKSFEGHAAVDDVSFDVPPGTFLCVVGPSGCGKSTLLRLIAGLLAPDLGRITLDGSVVSDNNAFVAPEDRSVGVVFQSYALWPHMTVAENVAFPYEAQGLSKAEALSRSAEHLKTVSLDAMADRRPEALSGGQRQRVALARCLAGEARTILMDEPLANLDPHLRGAMETEIKAFHANAGITTLYITHDQREAMALADVMAVMWDGRVQQIGAPQDIYDRPATQDVAGFIGRGVSVPVMVRSGAAIIGTQSVVVDGPEGPATLFFRPQQIAVSETGTPAQVASVHYRGGHWEAELLVEGVPTEIPVDLHQAVKPGDVVHVTFGDGWLLPN